jgi:ketosteroid isomerase-like protein
MFMAEHPNTQLIRDGYQAFSRGDMARLSELFTQDIQWHEAGGPTVPIAGDYKGQAAVFEMFGRLVELTDGQFHVVLIECVADDHQAVAIHEVSARRGRHTYQSREAIVFHLLEGKVTDAWHTVPDIDAFDGFWAEDSAAEHPNVALTRQGYQAFAAGDMATLAELIADDCVWHVPGSHPMAGDYRGRDAILGFFARLVDETGGQLQVELVDCMANDERTSSVTRATASRKGRTITMNETHLARLRDGRIVEFWEVPDDQAAADQFWS